MNKMTLRERLACCFYAIGKMIEKKKEEKPCIEVNVKMWGDDVKVSFTKEEMDNIYYKAFESATGHGVQ